MSVAPAVGKSIDVFFDRAHPDRDDIAQDALVAIANALHDFRGESSFLHYARQIAVRRIYVARRRGRAAKRAGEVVPIEDAEGAHETAHSTGPLVELAARRRTEVWLDLLSRLPEAQSEVLAMKVVLGLSIDEIASATQAPVNTVRKRILLAKNALREAIEKKPALFDELGGL
jgi:RNA polymerase sigma-70 factor (ECF subfamily)